MTTTGIGRRGARVVLGLVAAYAATSALLGWGTAGALAGVRAPGPAPADALVVMAAAATAWLLLTWLTVMLLLTVATAAVAGLGSPVQARVAALAPAVVRSCAAALLGLASLSLTTPAAVAGATPGPVERASAPARGGEGGARAEAATAAAVLCLDRPGATVPDGWTPDRPVVVPRRPASAEAAVRLVTAAPRAGRSVSDEVVVRRGDTLWAIAARHLGPHATAAEIAEEWPRWYAANQAAIGDDPGLLVPGRRLRAPGR